MADKHLIQDYFEQKKEEGEELTKQWICLEPTHFCIVLITVYGSFSTGLHSNTNFEHSIQKHKCTGMQHVTWVDKNETKQYKTPQVKCKNCQKVIKKRKTYGQVECKECQRLFYFK